MCHKCVCKRLEVNLRCSLVDLLEEILGRVE